MLRSKGFFWLASRLDKTGIWSQAGRVARLDFGGFWWAAIPREHWPESESFHNELEEKWHPEVGDCRQELVFIGIGIDEIAIYDSLQSCLLTDEEFAQGVEAWKGFNDPFPKWNIDLNETLAALSEPTPQG